MRAYSIPTTTTIGGNKMNYYNPTEENNMSYSIPAPNFTQVPNIIFDHWMKILTPGEFKVLLCICRKTFGWSKKKDRISLRQISEFTGLGRQSLPKMLNRLCDLGLLKKHKQKTEWGDDAPNEYEINVVDKAPKNPAQTGDSQNPGVGFSEYPQNKDRQNKEKESKPKKAPKRPPDPNLKKHSESQSKIAPCRKSKISSSSAKAADFSSFFNQELNKRYPDRKQPNLKKWEEAVEKTHRIDNRSYQDMYAVLRWALDHDFWKKNILSPEKFRKQYDTLKAQMGFSKENRALTNKKKSIKICRALKDTANRKGIRMEVLNQYVEFITGAHSTSIAYDDKKFDEKFKNLLKKMGLIQ